MAGKPAPPRWYLIQCKPKQDARAEEHLVRQAFRCYRPTQCVTRLRGGQKRESVESLFPGYLFIQLDQVNDNWHPIRSTRGVSQLVCFGDQPVAIADELIEQLQQRLASPQPQEPCLSPGDRIRLKSACLQEMEAIFLARDGTERVLILLQLLQREHTLSVPRNSVDKL
ncbi:transcription/translation regulatory transformer protein RfaH [Pseudomonas sp. BN414]|uniref:transcription/translation regulatory transformer protein RfaH n=1 Tax=Pseudomonas sp. BN414 TaxID=2567888 RepID=UPI002456EC8B|nr:transcription/translation regulatory transformer protein RfaH [Pseudomonas sp. BN414]MDH4568428.1 transcription/translation regulatory transformer protein RfaH [Pseudomonas sp. BN414]